MPVVRYVLSLLSRSSREGDYRGLQTIGLKHFNFSFASFLFSC